MRVESEISRSGVFWLVEGESELSGTLTVQDGGRIELELVGTFHGGVGRLLESPEIPTIYGEVEKLGRVTLKRCFYLSRNIGFGSISVSRLFANVLYCGWHFPTADPILATSFRFSIEGLDEWLCISGISTTLGPEPNTGSVQYRLPDPLTFTLDGAQRLLVNYDCTIPGGDIYRSATVTHRNFFEFESDVPIEIETFKRSAHQLSTFVGLAADTNLAIRDVTIRSTLIEEEYTSGKKRQIPMRVYYQSANFLEKAPKIDSSQMIVLFPAIKQDFGAIVNSWFDAYEKVAPALNLYFSTKNQAQKYLDGKFLALAQGLETFHRRTNTEQVMGKEEYGLLIDSVIKACPKKWQEWLSGRLSHGNEVSLANRLKGLLAEFESIFRDEKYKKRFVRNVVDTRNYLTHYDESLVALAVHGADLWPLCRKMEALFQLVLLKTAGLSLKQLDDLVAKSYRFQDKLRE